MAKLELIRKTFPKIRIVEIKGVKLYQVDARKQGTTGKREYFGKSEEAKKRAGDIASELLDGGTAALIDSKLRDMALDGAALLKPFNKTIRDAVDHYAAFLNTELAKAQSRTIDGLAKEWLVNKKKGSNRKLKAATLANIKQHAGLLETLWGKKHLLDFKEQDLQKYLDGLPHSQRRKFNIRSLTSQFFNWCIAKKYTTVNPVAEIKITVPRSKIHVLTPAEAQKHLEICEAQYPQFTLYVAISLFAGLRPMECQLLQWENIHLEEEQITVLDETSKIAETRNVPIEANLLLWLNAFKGERKGFVTRQTNFSNKIKQFRADLGYKVNGKNKEAAAWVEDTYRHSYASYWLAKNKDRAHLAEHMGNSLDIIRQHYKQIVSNSAQELFWNIKPGFPEIVTIVTDEQIRTARGKKLAKALAA